MTETERDPVPDPADLPEGSAEENPNRERSSMDYELEPSEDALERRAENEAAAQAGSIGGPAPDYAGPEEDRALAEGGEGVAEGFEESERALIDSAEHGDAGFVPEPAAPEAESDLSTAEYGEADQEQPPDQ